MSKRHISVLFLLCLFILFSMEAILDAEPIVSLKADDFKHDSSDPDSIPHRWERFIDFIYKNKIKASIGVIGRYLVTGSTIFYEKLKNIHEEGSIELWNHGYTHILHGKNENGETYHEFLNQPFWAQKLSLELTNTLALACTGIKFRTFGAPGNAIDDVTLEAISSMDK